MIEIALVAGARPNFMKIAPVLRQMSRLGSQLRPSLIHTGQHSSQEMSGVFFDQLGIRTPDVHLEVGPCSQGAQTGRILERLESEFIEHRPAAVLVVGDVNSTLAAALAATKLHIPVIHLEAGLRSHDRSMPEEINRLAIDAIADHLLVSEPDGEANLSREGIHPSRLHYVGNVMIDTLASEIQEARSLGVLSAFGVKGTPFVLATFHRPSNVDGREPLSRLVDFLEDLSSHLRVLFPIHPRTRLRLAEFGLLDRLNRVQLLEPLGYHQNIGLMDSAAVVLTDSGGMQEETTFLGTPCLTFRPSTERPVTVTEGTNTVVGSDFALADSLIADILDGRYKTGRPIRGWDGSAAQRVVAFLENQFAPRPVPFAETESAFAYACPNSTLEPSAPGQANR